MINISDITETVYEHISGCPTFTITAEERWSKTMVNRLKKKFPNEVDIRCVNDDGSMVVHMPFEWMRVIAKKTISMTEERKEFLSTQMKELRKTQLSENDANSDN